MATTDYLVIAVLAEEVIMVIIIIYVKRLQKRCGLTLKKNTYFPRKSYKSCGERGILIELKLVKGWLVWV